MQRLIRLFAVAVLVMPVAASAAGFEYPDHGARALGQGGAFTARPTDGTAIYYNPSGLAGQTGLQLTLEGEFAWLNATYQRSFEGQPFGDAVEQDHMPHVAPFVTLSYGILDNLTAAVGVYAPSAYGQMSWPDPRQIRPALWDGDLTNDPTDLEVINQQAPQRYDLIERDVIVLYPSLSVGWRPTEWLALGATGQIAMINTTFSKAIYGGTTTGQDPAFDAIASLDVDNYSNPRITGIFGATVWPAEAIAIGASVRPGFTMKQEGTLDIQFSDQLRGLAQNVLGRSLEQTENGATFVATLPWVWRGGVQVGKAGWHLAADAVFETWSDIPSLDISPNVNIQLCSQADPADCQPVEVADIQIVKNWRDAISLRFGGALDLQSVGVTVPLTVRAGYAFDSSAIPTTTFSLDYPAAQRNQATLGATWDFGWGALTVTGSHIFQETVEVSSTEVVQEVSPPPGFTVEPLAVGSGTYEAGYNLLLVGLQGKFGT